LHLTSTSSLAARYIKQRALECRSAHVRRGNPKIYDFSSIPEGTAGNVDSRLKRVYLQAPSCTKCVIGSRFNLSNIKSHNRKEERGMENENREEMRTERRKPRGKEKTKD
jgi:hypothetical protein